jgi:hypothetical protein
MSVEQESIFAALRCDRSVFVIIRRDKGMWLENEKRNSEKCTYPVPLSEGIY